MASKLDELMALADDFARECVFFALEHPDSSSEIADASRAALQSALKAVVEECEEAKKQAAEYKWMYDQLCK